MVVDNFPQLGLLTSLRFLEWVNDNPEGVISLPTGKTPEHFIKWTNHFIHNWDDEKLEKIRKDNGLTIQKKPELNGIHFVQIDEFYPISPKQHNSFYNYVQEYYIKGFGLNYDRGLFINCDEIPTENSQPLDKIFPESRVDLSLRFRAPESKEEEDQQQTIYMVDQWCSDYENNIEDKGGIGFFLGGVGPDGHIAFNVRGSDHNSTTRLMGTNFETQAAAATDLGGIEISKNRLVITIGLSTITANKDATAIIIAAGAAKAKIIKSSLECEPDNQYPATVLHRLKGSRFYLTRGAASQLSDSISRVYNDEDWSNEKTQRLFLQTAQKLNTFGPRLRVPDISANGFNIPGLDKNTLQNVIDDFKQKIEKGLTVIENETFLHTGPHHDDIMLGFLPYIIHLIRSPKNKHYFANMTSGFTSVTNAYIREVILQTKSFIKNNRIQMIEYPDFFDTGFALKMDKDVYHYLDRIAANNLEGKSRGLSHRVVRALTDIYGIKNKTELNHKIEDILTYLDRCYDGEKNIPEIQKLKGMIREFEEELVWAHYGVQVKDVRHLRLGFYSGDIFTEEPEQKRDVEPILNLLRELEPTVISLALDPEGSGPDTHYKVLQAIAEAVRQWGKETDLSKLKIWGYRNVWYRFDPAEADIIVPVSINSMAMLRDTFLNCYLSQKNASFPSYKLDGPFCDLTQKIWVEQHQEMEMVLGKDFWYQNDHPRLRATHGLVFLKELTASEFMNEARRLEKSMEGQV
ncbi:MAG: glucosamine-6-phosphate isomerase [Candidatus Marinimicrobia bacterium]|nr:glucosamine-6-phosphate isomerase [Candidatus Neomarinimicrobiota bacterium]MBL7009672.1 glucosamine-6-phosphate isomerase [Candidatus Neomarinimicrobiota bacterium]MBL7029585.1 glucosamine-6-phosphate isomerase [Candidatus Neomarinimicrobiota bacterium]